MPLNLWSEAVNRLAETPTARKHVSKTAAVRLALENVSRRLDEALPSRERLLVLSRPTTGPEADKVFCDGRSRRAS